MRLNPAFLNALEAVLPVRRDELLSRHTSMGVGGPADAYVIAQDAGQLAAAAGLCLREGVPYFLLGSGSNIVVGDRGIRGVTILNEATAVSEPAAQPHDAGVYIVRAESGASIAALARHLAFAGFEGLEWACGIPGTVGGAVVFNAGAYGGCLGDVLTRIAVVNAEGEQVLEAAELGLVYRGSDFTRGLMAGKVVLRAEFALHRGDAEVLRRRVQDYDGRRLKAQPRGRNAGSFFKNPPGQAAWKLIEAVGLRGFSVGDAQFSPQHCNFLVNNGHARAADVARLKRMAQERVRERFGIELEAEVSFVGEGFDDD